MPKVTIDFDTVEEMRLFFGGSLDNISEKVVLNDEEPKKEEIDLKDLLVACKALGTNHVKEILKKQFKVEKISELNTDALLEFKNVVLQGV